MRLYWLCSPSERISLSSFGVKQNIHFQDVQFDEHVFPFRHWPFSSPLNAPDFSSSPLFILQPATAAPQPTPDAPQFTTDASSPQPTTTAPRPATSPLQPAITSPPQPTTATATPSPVTIAPQPVTPTPQTTLLPQQPPWSTSLFEPPDSFDPFPSSLPIEHSPNPISLPLSSSSHQHSRSMITRTRDNSRKPKILTDFVAHMATLESKPHSFLQANSSSHWRAAMSSEIDALARNNTWILVPPPPDKRVIGCRWVYKIKRKPDGFIERYKTRIVAKGYHQQEGVDFFDTYSPVVRLTTIRAILSLALSNNWAIRQLDVQNAFLRGNLQKPVYMQQPPGFTDQSHSDHVCLLRKSLYGLKQAPRTWFNKLSSALIAFRFTPSSYDPSLFIHLKNGCSTLLLVYVDDIILTSNDNSHLDLCLSHLQIHFAMKDLGPLYYFLGIEASYSTKGIHLTQTKYILDLLSRVNMVNTKPCATPMASGTILSNTDSQLFDNPVLYRSVVGALQ